MPEAFEGGHQDDGGLWAALLPLTKKVRRGARPAAFTLTRRGTGAIPDMRSRPEGALEDDQAPRLLVVVDRQPVQDTVAADGPDHTVTKAARMRGAVTPKVVSTDLRLLAHGVLVGGLPDPGHVQKHGAVGVNPFGGVSVEDLAASPRPLLANKPWSLA